jgi:predicted alpha/beta superfamily hydrolase
MDELHEKMVAATTEMMLCEQQGGLSDDFWSVGAMATILQYFNQGRVDNKKEAINLYISEKREIDHNNAMAEDSAKRTRAAQDLAKYAKEAAISAAEQARHSEASAKSAAEAAKNISSIKDKLGG